MAAAPLSIVEPDVRISLIRLSPMSPFPASIHNETSPRWRALVPSHRRPRGLQHVTAAHQAVETVEAIPLLLFGFLAQLLSQFPQARRQYRFPQGKLLDRWLCRRLSHLANQLRVPLTRLDVGQGSLAPSRLDRNLIATMSPSDAPLPPQAPLWLPMPGCRWPTRRGASQVPGGSLGARCLLSPRGAGPARLIESARPVQASSSPADWPLPSSCNEAEPSSRAATARALAFPSLSGRDRSHSLKGRLHDFRQFIMADTFQLTRATELCLALSE